MYKQAAGKENLKKNGVRLKKRQGGTMITTSNTKGKEQNNLFSVPVNNEL